MPDREIDNADKDCVLLVWDLEGLPPVGDWTAVLWRQYTDEKSRKVVSIPGLVDQCADELRARYLAWIYDLGEARIRGGRVVDHLQIRPGFSYWWMSSLAQKFNISGTSGIDDAIKLLALERLVNERQPRIILLATGNQRLAVCVQNFCRNQGIGVESRYGVVAQSRKNFSSVFRFFPYSWCAFIYLTWYVVRVIPFLLRRKPTLKSAGEVAFIDVLTHLDRRAIPAGRFFSNYWTELIGKLSEWQINSTWLHLFFRHSGIASPIQAQSQVERFNENARGAQFHALIERSLNIRVIFKALRDYLAIRRAKTLLSEISKICPGGSDLDLWPLHVEEWNDSLGGKEAMINCLRLALFEAAVSSLACQRIGVYIAENQPWEMALIYTWKAAGHGTLVGTPHTTVRFWDLRYYYDRRSYERRQTNDLPMPDLLAVNGPVARDAVLGGGFPADRVREVEALRFLYLLRTREHSATTSPAGRGLRVLACGDFLPEVSRRIISWLEVAASTLPPDTTYVFKPHPAYPLTSTDYSAMKLEITEAPLHDLLSDCDVVFASNITSAVVDAYCMGVPTVQMRDGSSFNLSPLRGLKGMISANTPEELAGALLEAKGRASEADRQYFYLDAELPRWRVLLSE